MFGRVNYIIMPVIFDWWTDWYNIWPVRFSLMAISWSVLMEWRLEMAQIGFATMLAHMPSYPQDIAKAMT